MEMRGVNGCLSSCLSACRQNSNAVGMKVMPKLTRWHGGATQSDGGGSDIDV